MKKIIALALALIMALSMGVVAMAKATAEPEKEYKVEDWTMNLTADKIYPGDAIEFYFDTPDVKDSLKGVKITKVDFTTGELEGASMIESVKLTKENDAIRLTVKESYTMAEETAKDVHGKIYITANDAAKTKAVLDVTFKVNNKVENVTGAKKAGEAVDIAGKFGKNTVTVMDEDGGYVTFACEELSGVVKMNKDEKTYLNVTNAIDADDFDALEALVGEEYFDDAVVEYYSFETRAFKNDVDFQYDAYEEDPHFFYVFDGEKLTAIDAKYDADEDVDNYVFTTVADGIFVIADTEIVLAAEDETKNPDTGANDVVGVAAALAVVSLVAAGAVSLKK